MGSIVLDLVEMVDIENFDFMNEILHCSSIVKEMQRSLMFYNGVDKFYSFHTQKFIINQMSVKGELLSRYLSLLVVGDYDPVVDLIRSFDLTISDLNINPDGSNASIVDYPECPLKADSGNYPRCFVRLYLVEYFFESAIEFCLLYLKSRQDKNAVLWVGEVLSDDMFLSYSELLYLWERFKGKQMEDHEWFVYGWPDIVQMRAAQTNH